MARTNGTDILDAVRKYFEETGEVSSLYVSKGMTSGPVTLAVLVKDAGKSFRDLEYLRRTYTRHVSGMLGNAVMVTVLNSASPETKCRILHSWNLSWEQNRSFRSWFERQAASEYHAASAARAA